jgi:hypothetical protein
VNQQISDEATQILYTANEFIIVRVSIPNPDEVLDALDHDDACMRRLQPDPWVVFESVPAFKRLSRRKVTTPALKVTIATRADKQRYNENWITLIITPEAIPCLFEALWIYGRQCEFYKNWVFALEFCKNVPSRNKFLTETILKTWDQMYSVGEVLLTGDIDAAVINHLKQPLTLCAFEDDMVRYMDIHQSRAESYYERNNYPAAYFYWHHMQQYWNYHVRLKDFADQSSAYEHSLMRLEQAVKIAAPKVMFSVLGLVKVMLRFRNYGLANRIARCPDLWLNKYWDPIKKFVPPEYSDPILKAKFEFSCALCLVAQGEYPRGKVYIKDGVNGLRNHCSRYHKRAYQDIFDEVCKAIDNEMIEAGSRWRCGRWDKVGVQSRGGTEWQLRVRCPSFWDLLELPAE